MKDASWVFKQFGFKAGILFVMGSLGTGFKRLIGVAKKPKKFEELSPHEVEMVEKSFGIYRWRDPTNHNENRTLH